MNARGGTGQQQAGTKEGGDTAAAAQPAASYESMWWDLHDDLQRISSEVRRRIAYGIERRLSGTEATRGELDAVNAILQLMKIREAGTGVLRSHDTQLPGVSQEPADGGAEIG